MATYGALFSNANGDTIIDGTNPCCFLHEVGDKTFTSGTWSGGISLSGYKSAIIPFDNTITTQEPPFVCGYSVSGDVIFGYIVGSPGAWTGMMCCASQDYYYYGDSTFARGDKQGRLKYAVFSRKGAIRTNDNYGMIINNESGEQVFDSRKFPFCLEGNFQYTRWGYNDGSTINIDQLDYPFYKDGIYYEPPTPNSWPLLTTLNQMLWVYTPDWGLLGKVIVRKEGTGFRYRLGLFYGSLSSAPAYTLAGGADNDGRSAPNFDTLPNLGGGQSAYNLIVYGRVPSFIQ